jgi:small conductance mechanosensitive channel
MDRVISFVLSYTDSIVDVGYNMLMSAVVLVMSIILARWMVRTVPQVNSRIDKIDATLMPMLMSIATYATYTVGAIIILDIWGVNTTSIIALLGAAGLAIGFALKDTLSNIAAGLMLLMLRPFKAGDFIEYESVMGTVIEVNLFTTIIHTYDGLYISSPNGLLWGNSITNYSRNGKRMMNIAVGIAYHDSIDKGLAVLHEIATNETRFLDDPAPQVMVTALGDSAVTIQLRGWALTSEYWQTYWDLNKQVKESIEAAGLTIPFPQRMLHMIPASLPTTKD